MSEFWNCTEPPKSTDVVKWCEENVEMACLDMVKHLKVMAWFSEKKGSFTVEPYVGDNWDLEGEGEGETVVELLMEAAEGHVSWIDDPDRAGIYGETGEKVEAALKEIEAVIEEVRSWIKDGPCPEAQAS